MKPEAFRELFNACGTARASSVEIRAESATVRTETRELVDESRQLRAVSHRIRLRMQDMARRGRTGSSH